MKIVRADTTANLADERLGHLRASVFPLAVSELGRSYYGSIECFSRIDDSFLWETVDGTVLAATECNCDGGILTRFGQPIEIRLSNAIPQSKVRRLLRETIGELRRIARVREATRIVVRTSAATDPDGLIAGQLLNEGGIPSIDMRAVIDLAASDDELLADLRKGHRQQVRWGQTHIALSYVDADNPDREAFERFRHFHAEVAGRITRSTESWDIMFSAIVGGRGDLVLGTLGDTLVSGTLILDALGTAHYTSGVYDRKQFDKPLAHATLFTAMLRAKRRGLARFDVGDIPVQPSSATSKDWTIGYFKRGFSSRTQSSIVWTCAPE